MDHATKHLTCSTAHCWISSCRNIGITDLLPFKILTLHFAWKVVKKYFFWYTRRWGGQGPGLLFNPLSTSCIEKVTFILPIKPQWFKKEPLKLVRRWGSRLADISRKSKGSMPSLTCKSYECKLCHEEADVSVCFRHLPQGWPVILPVEGQC